MIGVRGGSAYAQPRLQVRIARLIRLGFCNGYVYDVHAGHMPPARKDGMNHIQGTQDVI